MAACTHQKQNSLERWKERKKGKEGGREGEKKKEKGEEEKEKKKGLVSVTGMLNCQAILVF